MHVNPTGPSPLSHEEWSAKLQLLGARVRLPSFANVACWPKREVPTALTNVRFLGQPGSHLLTLSSSQFDP
jgi:hypothetical protein